jgi:hypothetical protein
MNYTFSNEYLGSHITRMKNTDSEMRYVTTQITRPRVSCSVSKTHSALPARHFWQSLGVAATTLMNDLIVAPAEMTEKNIILI